MNYPLISEYIEAIRSAEDNLDELSFLRPVLSDDGEPVMSAGGFSVVFKMKDERDGKLYAVKCFTKDQKGRSESYKLIADELEFVSSNFLTPIRYLDKELFVDTDQTPETEFPVLLMDWVDGIPMDKFIQKNINNQYALDMLAFRFSRMATWLLTQPYAHGDLKPDNILVKDDGSIVLVDYDGMYVPAMKGQRARELGSPNYRHHLRTDNDFNRHIDDFPLVIIALSLKAIALKPVLFRNNIGECGLLLNESDFRDIKSSKILYELMCLMPNNDLCSLLGLFFVVLSQNKLEVLLSDTFVLSKPIKRIDEPEINISTIKNALSNDIVRIYNKACSMINEKRYKNAYIIFRQMSLYSYGQNGLGVCYAYGFFVEKDMEKAAYWFLKAARGGFSVAQFNIANCYYNGNGVIEDRNLAYHWYNKAYEQGLSVAREMLTYEGVGGKSEWGRYEDKLNVKRWNKIASIYILRP
ncbi:MAG: SEL1-like repeat protein [Prevotella sp.]|nr:SEL1-like repeat protein [Prevotella sp.]